MSGFEPVIPAYFTIKADARKPYSPDRRVWFGSITFTLRTVSAVHVGTGAPRIVEATLEDGSIEATIAAAMTTTPVEGHAVIPGSSMKGAVRAVFEVLTSSCAATDPACGDCAACKTFGAPGQRGRAGFDDVVFRTEPLDLVDSPQRYQGKAGDEPVRRFYGPTPEQSAARAIEQLLCVADEERNDETTAPAEAPVHLVVRGVDEPCLGAIVASLGAAPDTLPHFRVGGGKNRGLGIVEIVPSSLRLAPDPLSVLTTEPRPADPAALTRWVEQARQRFSAFDRVLGELRDGYRSGSTG